MPDYAPLFALDDPIVANLLKSRFQVPRGTAVPGDTVERIRTLMRFVEDEQTVIPQYALEPGDFAGLASQRELDISVSAPIAYDVYYLWINEDFMPADPEENAAWVEDEDEGRLYDEVQAIGGGEIALLKAPNAPAEMLGYSTWADVRQYFEGSALHRLNGIRYEMIHPGLAWDHGTDFGGGNEDFCLYLGFPVGQLGAQEIMAMVSDAMPDDWKADGEVLADAYMSGLMPPVPATVGRCIGKQIVTLGYVLANKEKECVEYPADFPNLQPVYPKYYLRYWASKEDAWPMPGEFIGLLIKPLPFHLWWYQKTSPLMYAGAWFEHWQYSGGVVKEIVEEGAPKKYRVRCRGMDIEIQGTDWYEYEVDERVAIIKRNDVANPVASFKWTDIDDEPDEEQYSIIPAAYYTDV